MLSRLRPRSAYDVVAVIALFAAIGTGSAYAVNEWTGANIVDESLTGADVEGKASSGTTPAVNGSLSSADIAGQQAVPAIGQPFIDGTLNSWDVKDGTLQGRDVLNNTLKGADVLESSLAKVPDADRLDGVDSSQFQQVGLVTAGAANQTESEGYAFLLRWDELGVSFTTDGDTDVDDTMRIVSTRPESVSMRWGASSYSIGGGSEISVSVDPLQTLLLWSADGARTWVVTCADESGGSLQIRCHGVANRVG